MKQQVVSFLVSIFIVGCGQVEKNESSIEFRIENLNDTVFIKTFDMLDYHENKLGNVLLKEGKGSLTVSQTTPLFVSIDFKETKIQLYLTPGNNIKIEGSKGDLRNTINFKGKGSVSNNYRLDIGICLSKYQNLNDTFFLTLSTDELSTRIIELDKDLLEIHKKYSVMEGITQFDRDLIIQESKILVLNLQLNYCLVRLGSNRDEVTAEFLDFENRIPLDGKFLDYKMTEYANLMNFYMDWEIRNYLWSMESKTISTDTLAVLFPEIVHDYIRLQNYPPEIKEYLQAKNIYGYLSAGQLSQQIDSIYNDFSNNWVNSEYQIKLDQLFDELTMLSQGKPAPNILATLPSGDEVLISDFRGKVLLIDVWATWCSPCYAQFPFVQKIKQKYLPYEDFEVVYLSVDSDVNNWRQELSVLSNYQGVHLNTNQKDLFSNYKIDGIPRYILLDSNGNIVMLNAPSPSSDELDQMIGELLTKPKL